MNSLNRLKILKGSSHQFNTSVYLLLSLVFLHMIGAKYLETSGLNIKALDFSLRNFVFFPPITIFCIYAVKKFKSYSSQFLLLHMCGIWAASFWILYLSHLDKILLGLIFFEVLISFYFYQLWNEELHLACHNPDFSVFDLDPGSFHQISAELIQSENTHQVLLTNWDENSCFVKSLEKLKLSGDVKLVLSYDGQKFEESGKIVSEYGDYQGLGIKFNFGVKKYEHFNWKNFYEVIHERSILPVWVK